jgi:hypothetical protein
MCFLTAVVSLGGGVPGGQRRTFIQCQIVTVNVRPNWPQRARALPPKLRFAAVFAALLRYQPQSGRFQFQLCAPIALLGEGGGPSPISIPIRHRAAFSATAPSQLHHAQVIMG